MNGPRQRHKSWLQCAALLLPIVAASPAARAAPFCVVAPGLSPDCVYADAAECGSRAERMRGQCALNPDAPPLPRQGGGAFCVVQSSTSLSCFYADRASCQYAGDRGRSTCVESPAQADPPSR